MQVNKIYNGDCFDLFRQMDDKSVDYVFTSPPYNRKRNDVYSDYDDTLDDYYGFLLRVIEECRRVAKVAVFVNLQTNYYNRPDIYRLIGTYADNIKNIVIWEKTNPTPARKNVLCNAYELFLIITSGNVWVCDEQTKNIITSSVNMKTYEQHKAVMKYEVCEWFINHFTKPGTTVLDPFMGTGTTAVACMKNSRNYIGFELVSGYCEIAEQRLKREDG